MGEEGEGGGEGGGGGGGFISYIMYRALYYSDHSLSVR